jgi:glycosyltransferase involved in cell wall biosynthesis
MSQGPMISVITPSLNQGSFIEENIQSVLEQNYVNFEHIIIDGGSSDETREILAKYPHLKWISEPDGGQADALNKGFLLAKGDVIGWLNADDYYLPGTFEHISRALDKSRGHWVVMGDVELTDERGRLLQLLENHPKKFHELLRYWDPHLRSLHQPGVFFFKEVLNRVGLLDVDLHLAMDYDLWLRMSRKFAFYRVNATVARYRLHAASKSNAGWDAFMPEWELVSRRHAQELALHYRLYYLLCYAAFKHNAANWLPSKLRKLMGLPRIRKKRLVTRGE